MTSPTRPRHTARLMTVRRVIGDATGAHALVRVYLPAAGSTGYRVVEGTPVALDCKSDGRERVVIIVHAETEIRIATNRIIRVERIDGAGNVDLANSAGELPEASSAEFPVARARAKPPTLRGAHLRGRKIAGEDGASASIDERVTSRIPAQRARPGPVQSVRRRGHTATIPDVRKPTRS